MPNLFSQKRATRSLRLDRTFSITINPFRSQASGLFWYVCRRARFVDSFELSPRQTSVHARWRGIACLHTSHPKNGGNIHVATGSSEPESLLGMTSEKTHWRSLVRARWAREGVNEVCCTLENIRVYYAQYQDTLAANAGT